MPAPPSSISDEDFQREANAIVAPEFPPRPAPSVWWVNAVALCLPLVAPLLFILHYSELLPQHLWGSHTDAALALLWLACGGVALTKAYASGVAHTALRWWSVGTVVSLVCVSFVFMLWSTNGKEMAYRRIRTAPVALTATA